MLGMTLIKLFNHIKGSCGTEEKWLALLRNKLVTELRRLPYPTTLPFQRETTV